MLFVVLLKRPESLRSHIRHQDPIGSLGILGILSILGILGILTVSGLVTPEGTRFKQNFLENG
jgi:hypothetical protein